MAVVDAYVSHDKGCSHNSCDAGIIEVFWQIGMRLLELAKLVIDDLELPTRITRDPDTTGSASIRRKGGKLVTIPLHYKAGQTLASWLKVRSKVEHRQVFISKFHTTISPRAIQYTITGYMHEAGIIGASVHILRHIMVTHHVARDTDLKTVQETLGHASEHLSHSLM